MWNSSGVNMVHILGEVIDTGAKVSNNRLYVRARIRIRDRRRNVFVDVYGRNQIAEIMNLACKNGNIVLIQGRFRNIIADDQNHIRQGTFYIDVVQIRCLLKPENRRKPSQSILQLLDSIDPIGYFGAKPPRAKKHKRGGNEDE